MLRMVPWMMLHINFFQKFIFAGKLYNGEWTGSDKWVCWWGRSSHLCQWCFNRRHDWSLVSHPLVLPVLVCARCSKTITDFWTPLLLLTEQLARNLLGPLGSKVTLGLEKPDSSKVEAELRRAFTSKQRAPGPPTEIPDFWVQIGLKKAFRRKW